MAEGVAVSGTGQVVGDAVMNDRNAKPDPDPVKAPYGWAWDRTPGRWRPAKKRGQYPRAKAENASSAAPADSSPAAGPGHPLPPEDGRDPDPAWFAGGDRPPPPPPKRLSIDDVPAQVVNDIAGFAGLIGAPLLAMLQTADPYCGSVLAQNFQPIVDATLPLLCRSERIVAYFTGDKSDWLLWGKLAIALAPVGRAIIEHHVIRSVHVIRDEKTGAVQVVRGQQAPGPGDHLTPPMQPPPNYQYAA